jgi:hypothetical protein
MVSFPQASPPKPCAHLSPPPIRATCPAHLILDFTTRTICLSTCEYYLTWVFTGRVVSTSPNPQAGGPPLFGCPRLLIQFIRSYPPLCTTTLYIFIYIIILAHNILPCIDMHWFIYEKTKVKPSKTCTFECQFKFMLTSEWMHSVV